MTREERERIDQAFRDGWREGVEDAKEAVSFTRTGPQGVFLTAAEKCQALLDGDPAGGTIASSRVVSAPGAAIEVIEHTLTPEAREGLSGVTGDMLSRAAENGGEER